MNSILSLQKAEEYITIAALTVIIFFCALLALVVGFDPVIILTTIGCWSSRHDLR